MAKKKEKTEEIDIFLKIIRKIEFFFEKNSKWVLISLGVIIIILVGFFGTRYLVLKKEEKAAADFGKVYLVYSNIQSSEDLSEKQKIEELNKIIPDFEYVIETHQNTKAAYESEYFLGHIYFIKGDFEKSLEYFEKASSGKKNFYITILSLVGKGTCLEELGKYNEAISLYEMMIKKYKDSYLVPYLEYSIAQIFEKQKKFEAAQERYTKLIEKYGWSSWSQFADKKLILIKSFI